MKILTLAIIGSLLIHCSIFSQQTVDHILAEIEHNNTSLSALRKSMDAEKTGNKTGIYIQNPEIEFNYLWGSPSIIGKRTDFKLTQSIDFPSAYGHRSKISDIKNEQVNYTYKQELQRLRLESRLLCYDLIFANALSAELSKRLVHAQGIADAFQSQYDLGETNVLEYNKSQLNLLNLNNKLETVNIERSALLSELARLNGGNPVVLEDTVFQLAAIPVDFEQWFHNAQQYNHILNWLGQEIEINRKEKQLNTALSLPKLSAGYMSEKVIGNQFQGITLGLSIPLWENKNTIKYAKAKRLALQDIELDKKLQFYLHLKMLYTKASGLQNSVGNYRSQLAKFSNSEFLLKALEQGQISLIEYMLEFAIYYEGFTTLLELERELHRTLAELNQYI